MSDWGDPDFDDTHRVSRDDDDLRGTLVLGPDGEELIYTPADDYVPISQREFRALAAKHADGPRRRR